MRRVDLRPLLRGCDPVSHLSIWSVMRLDLGGVSLIMKSEVCNKYGY